MATIHRITVIGTYFGQTFNNVVNMQETTGLLTPEEVADEFDTEWVFEMNRMVSQNVKWTGIRVQPLTAGPPAPFNKTVAYQGQQSPAGTEFTFVAGVIKIFTAIGGRHGRGRVYIPGVGNNTTEQGVLRPDVLNLWKLTIIDPFVQKFNAANGTSPLSLGVMGKSPSSPWHPMTSLQMRGLIGVQRRRNIGIGM